MRDRAWGGLFARLLVVAGVVAGLLSLATTSSTALGAGAEGKIIGGTPAAPGAWPAQVGLLRSEEPDNYQAQFCGGTLVDRQWVLTAAHCMFDDDGMKVAPAAIKVLIGTQSLASGGTRRGVAEIRIMPGFNPDTFDRDLAMIKLISPTTNPVQAFTGQGIGVAPNTEVVATGWGTMTDGGNDFPTELQQVAMRQQSDATCSAAYGTAFHANTMSCAGSVGKDTCQGDSGGPLVTKRNGVWVQVGITSWGEGCAERGFPGISTRLSSFADWVRAQINPRQGAARVTISARLTATKITVGTVVYAEGTVTPAGATPRVVLQRNTGGRWSDRGAALVNRTTGAYRIKIQPSATGTYTMRVRSNGGSVVTKTIYLIVSPRPPAPGVYYANCAAAWAAGAAPIYRGQPGYRAGLDGDNDGIACEQR